MNEEILKQLLSVLHDKIDILKNDLEKMKIEHDNVKVMGEFLNLYKSNKFDHNLLEKFYFELELDEDITFYCMAQDTLNKLEQSDSDIFLYQIDKCKKIIAILIDKIKKKYNKSVINDGKLVYQVKDARLRLEMFSKISNSLNEDGITEIFDEEMSAIFFDLLNACNLSNEQKNEIALWFTKNNTYLINKNITSIINGRKIEKKKEQNSKIEKIVKPKKEIVIETPVVIEEKNDINDDKSKLLQKIKRILAQNKQNLTTTNSDFDNLVLEVINEQTLLIDRICLYETAKNVETKKRIIIKDIEQLLPNIDNHATYCLLEGIVKIYDDIEMKQIQELDLYSKLNHCNLNEEMQICYKIDKILDFCENSFVKNYHGSYEDLKYSNLYNLYCEIYHAYENCKAAVDLYLEVYDEVGNDELESAKELISEPFNLVKKFIIDFETEYNLIYNPQKPQEEILKEKADEFYNSVTPIKNIYIFVDNIDSETSDFENYIINDNRLRDSDYKSILQELNNRISSNYNDGKDHKVKSSNYADEFLNKYRVKSMNDDTSRIFYSRFNTTLSASEMGYDDVHIVLLYNVGYGALDGNEKNNLNENALKIYYTHKTDIDQLVDLFNTPWHQLSEKDKKSFQSKIKYIIEKNKIKLGHLISTYQKNIEPEEGTYGSK